MSGKSKRVGLDIFELMDMFPNEEVATEWFENIFWAGGRVCGHCGSERTVERKNRKPLPYRCKDCRKDFSVRHGTVMQHSKIPLRKWAVAIYQLTTGLKGTSSRKLHRDINVSYACTWHLSHRIREAWTQYVGVKFDGENEVDETYIGGKEANKHNSKKLKLGRGVVGKTAVTGVKNRRTKQVRAKVVERTDSATLQGFVEDNVEQGATVYTDEATAYQGMVDFEHKSVKHSVGEFVKGMASTNGIESFWAMLKRGYMGTYHKMSAKHLARYVNEFVGRHNIRDLDTIEQMICVTRLMKGKQLQYKELIAPPVSP
ncbi:MAG: IS1595 family transposase [Gammaproteobacteria bacterium]|nr:IS1595 family transposase [Gammaproteobacteria bacterium]MYF38731.1 IS1595 family transposase [Gammaproteobacteria bacterium]